MSLEPRFNLPQIGRRRNLGYSEVAVLLDQLPQAALLVDTNQKKVLLINAKAGELTGYETDELENHQLTELFPAWVENLLVSGEDKRQVHTDVITKAGETLPFQVTRISMASQGRRALFVLEPESPAFPKFTERLDMAHFWEAFHQLQSSTQHTSLKPGLEQSLRSAQLLSGADTVAIYRVGNKGPGLEMVASLGNKERLPFSLPPQDLGYLRDTFLWKRDQRTRCSLHRAARTANFSYLATAPLGQSKAVIGLVLLAGSGSTPKAHILSLARSFADVVTSILQHHALTSALDERLQDQTLMLAVSQTLETAVQAGVILLRPDLTTWTMNPAAELMLGYATREVDGQPIENVLIGTDSLYPALQDAQNGHPTYNVGNLRLYRRNGEAFLVHVSTLPVIDAGTVQGVLILIDDLSQEEQFRVHTQQLEQRAILGEFTAIFAHEVRNPINNIGMNLELLEMTLSDDTHLETIHRMQQDCDRLENLTKNILSFSRPTEYEMEPVDVGDLVHRLIGRLRPHLTRVNVSYDVYKEPGCPQINGNVRALEQVFNNLINNAVNAMGDKGGRLVIRVQTRFPEPGPRQTPENGTNPQTYVEISVADNGPGIPKELHERIFQPFFTTNHSTGTGLGLAITKRIVTAHKGSIGVESFPGATVFTVLLPVSDQTENEIEARDE